MRFTWSERKRSQKLIVHMEALDEIRIISFRKATVREQEIYFAQIRD